MQSWRGAFALQGFLHVLEQAPSTVPVTPSRAKFARLGFSFSYVFPSAARGVESRLAIGNS